MTFSVNWAGPKANISEFHQLTEEQKVGGNKGQHAAINAIVSYVDKITRTLVDEAVTIGINASGHYDENGKGSHSLSVSVY